MNVVIIRGVAHFHNNFVAENITKLSFRQNFSSLSTPSAKISFRQNLSSLLFYNLHGQLSERCSSFCKQTLINKNDNDPRPWSCGYCKLQKKHGQKYSILLIFMFTLRVWLWNSIQHHQWRTPHPPPPNERTFQGSKGLSSSHLRKKFE